MTQILKEHIRNTIIAAALQEFANHGYLEASIAEIAKQAGISTGNIYRYFSSKAELFNVVIPDVFVKKCLAKLRQRVSAYPIGTEPDAIPSNSTYSILSEELLEFTITNKLQVLIILEGAAGTCYESLPDLLKEELAKKAIQTLNLTQFSDDSEMLVLIIKEIYQNFLKTIGVILRKFSDPVRICSAINIYSKYHLAGLSKIVF